MNGAPCYNCPDRTVHPNCHEHCALYRDYALDNKIMSISRRVDSDVINYTVNTLTKRKERGRRRR